MSDDVHRYLVAYDIPDDRRRDRLAKRLLSHGDRVQYSVFVADCRPARLVRLRQLITTLVLPDEDSVLVCDLGPVRLIDPARFSYIGRGRPVTDAQSFVV